MTDRRSLLLPVVAALAALSGCGQDSAPTAPAVSAAPTAPVPPPRPPWPPLEEGHRLVGEPLTRNYYIVFDGSGSMNESRCAEPERSKLGAAKKAVVAFAASLPADANIGVLSFDVAGMRERLALTRADQADVGRVVRGISAGGVTPLRSALAHAYRALTMQAKNQHGYGEYHLVVVTDGEFNPQPENPEDMVEQILTESPVVIHTIGFCIGSKHSLNQSGRTLYRAANNPGELQAGLGEVLAESPDFNIKKFR